MYMSCTGLQKIIIFLHILIYLLFKNILLSKSSETKNKIKLQLRDKKKFEEGVREEGV